MKRKLFSTILCALLSVTLLSGTAWAQVWIADTELLDGEYYKNNGGNTGVEAGDASNYNAHFDSGTLYLNNLNVEATGFKVGGLYSSSDITLDVSGDNTISTVAAPQPTANAAVTVHGDLTIKGDGTLNAIAGGRNPSFGVLVNGGSLKVEDATLNASATSSEASRGIYSDGGVEISDGATIIASARGGTAVAIYTGSIVLPASYDWRTDPTGEFKHSQEDAYTLSFDRYAEIRSARDESASESASATIITIEKTKDGYLANAEYDSFFTLWVDGETLDAENYTVKAENGKTLVKLSEDYLAALTKGEHILQVNFTFGCAKTLFTVE